MSYGAEKTISKATAMRMLRRCKYGDIDMAMIYRIAEQCTEFDCDRERIGMRDNSGLDCVFPLFTTDSTDYLLDYMGECEIGITAAAANELLGVMADTACGKRQPCQPLGLRLRLYSIARDWGYGCIIVRWEARD